MTCPRAVDVEDLYHRHAEGGPLYTNCCDVLLILALTGDHPRPASRVGIVACEAQPAAAVPSS